MKPYCIRHSSAKNVRSSQQRQYTSLFLTTCVIFHRTLDFSRSFVDTASFLLGELATRLLSESPKPLNNGRGKSRPHSWDGMKAPFLVSDVSSLFVPLRLGYGVGTWESKPDNKRLNNRYIWFYPLANHILACYHSTHEYG